MTVTHVGALRFDSVGGHGWHPTATNMEEPESNTRCVHCGYEWTYSGYGDVKPVATCPSCGNKTPTENIEEEANA